MQEGFRFQGFDWDEGNLEKNHRKHGMDQKRIEGMFDRPTTFRESTSSKDKIEKRFVAVGKDEAGRPMMVAFTFRDRGGKRLLRPISARYMHEKEAKGYETRNQESEEG